VAAKKRLKSLLLGEGRERARSRDFSRKEPRLQSRPGRKKRLKSLLLARAENARSRDFSRVPGRKKRLKSLLLGEGRERARSRDFSRVPGSSILRFAMDAQW